GKVSTDYLFICKREGFKLDSTIHEGARLLLTDEYLKNAVDLVSEAGVRFSMHFWRSVYGQDLGSADNLLSEYIVDLLNQDNVSIALNLSELAITMGKHSDNTYCKIANVNYALSLKMSQRSAEAVKFLDKQDWSACIDDFKLAKAVIK